MPECEFRYGLIEGFYGKPWTWFNREQSLGFLREHGYQFYIYAPKSDLFLREDWLTDWPEARYDRLERFASACRANGLLFGVGLSPFEIYKDFSAKARESLSRKILSINRLDPDILCLCFDDMRGDVADLAEIQARVFDHAAAAGGASRLIVCPSYYSSDPVLERVYGRRPENYLEDLGRLLDSRAEIFWTGPEICSTEYTRIHLEEVAESLRRKPFIWDNYPVNDSPRMSPYPHLRAFTGRPWQMSEWTAGHAVNPMNQAWLSRIPLKTLWDSYLRRDEYDPEKSCRESALALCGPELGGLLFEDIPVFQDRGLKQMTEAEKAGFLVRYQDFSSPYAEEITRWLRGDYEPGQ